MHQPPSPRTRVQRGARRANYDPAQIKAILDAAWLCHLSVGDEQGAICIPTIYGRIDNEIFVHGSSKSGLLSRLTEQLACVVVSVVDGLVLARSAFHHSVNYRSVVMYAHARHVTDRDEKMRALDCIIDHVLPERSLHCRPANETELKATAVYAIDIRNASAKIRQGPPNDDSKDHALDHWAGVIPIHTRAQNPVRAPDLRANIELPDALVAYRLPEEADFEPPRP